MKRKVLIALSLTGVFLAIWLCVFLFFWNEWPVAENNGRPPGSDFPVGVGIAEIKSDILRPLGFCATYSGNVVCGGDPASAVALRFAERSAVGAGIITVGLGWRIWRRGRTKRAVLKQARTNWRRE